MSATKFIFCGDNLRVARELSFAIGKVDLVYVDPPSEFDLDYMDWTVGSNAPSWHLYGKVGKYIEQMRPRIAAMRSLLNERGSIYYHCDWRVEAYVRVMLDEIFGQNNFRSHIIWRRGVARGRGFRSFQNTHDSILFYTKSDSYTFNPQYLPHDVEYIENTYKYTEHQTGRRYRLISLTSQNKDTPPLTYEFLGVLRTWRWTEERMQKAYDEGLIVQTKPESVPMLKQYLDEHEGTPVDNIWTDILPVKSNSKQSLGYSAQKPLELLERIIRASTNEGDVVLDAFCGSGTTLHAAQKLSRDWIGIDVSPTACQLSAQRIEDNFGLEEGRDYTFVDLSKSINELKDYSPLEFESWVMNALANSLAQGRKIADFYSGKDAGIDFVIYSANEGRDKQEENLSSNSSLLAVQVKKKEAVGRSDIQGFKTALRRQKCPRGLFVAFGFTSEAKSETEDALTAEGVEIKLLTVEDILGEETTRLT